MKFEDIIQSHTLYGIIRHCRDIIFSRLILGRQIKLVKFPFYIFGARHITFGKGFVAGVNLRIEALSRVPDKKPSLIIGDFTKFNDNIHIGCISKIRIGSNTLLGSHILIEDHNHGVYKGEQVHDSPDIPPEKRKYSYADVEIGDNVWIGDQVCVLPGAKIGNGAVIGAMSLVNSEIPPHTMAAGIPAKVIKQFNFENNRWEKVC